MTETMTEQAGTPEAAEAVTTVVEAEQLAAVAEQPKREPPQLGPHGIRLDTLDELWRYAQYVAETNFPPKEMRGKAADCLVAMELGKELGLPVMAALQSVAVINGRPALYGDGLLGVCQSSPSWDWTGYKEEFTGEPGKDDFTAVCQVKRKEMPEPVVRTFSIADAKTAKLWARTGRDGQPTPWVTYPRRMLQCRARGIALRDTFADVIRGMHSEDEAKYIDAILDRLDLSETPEQIAAADAAPKTLDDLAGKPPLPLTTPTTNDKPVAPSAAKPATPAPAKKTMEDAVLNKLRANAAKALVRLAPAAQSRIQSAHKIVDAQAIAKMERPALEKLMASIEAASIEAAGKKASAAAEAGATNE